MSRRGAGAWVASRRSSSGCDRSIEAFVQAACALVYVLRSACVCAWTKRGDDEESEEEPTNSPPHIITILATQHPGRYAHRVHQWYRSAHLPPGSSLRRAGVRAFVRSSLTEPNLELASESSVTALQP